MSKITKTIRSVAIKNFGLNPTATDQEARALVGKKISDGAIDLEDLVDDPTDPNRAVRKTVRDTALVTKIFGGTDSPRVRVMGASESYSRTKAMGRHKKTGKPVMDPFTGKDAEEPSQLEIAKSGAYLRWLAHRCGIQCRPLDDHERDLMSEMVEEDTWTGNVNGNIESEDGWEKSISPSRVKALLSDNTSGGLAINPLFFDQNLVTFPLLYGELFPMVDLVEMPRYNIVNTASISNPSVAWGTPEGTAITLFNTTALSALISSTVQNVTVAIQIGRDFLSDAAADVGRYVTEVVNNVFQQQIDIVIANGDGVTQTQGIFQASGTIAVTPDNGTSGPPTIGDYESLMFSVPKQYRQKMLNPCYISNDVAYQRARGIPVGPFDQRRVFGMDEGDYTVFSWPNRISQQLANGKVGFAALKKYRLWRRQGFELRWIQEGQTLALQNLVMLVVRGRFCGKLIDANAAALITNGQS